MRIYVFTSHFHEYARERDVHLMQIGYVPRMVLDLEVIFNECLVRAIQVVIPNTV